MEKIIHKNDKKYYYLCVNDLITLNFSAKVAGSASVMISDLSGRVIMNSASSKLVAGKNNISINTESLSAGMYFVTLMDGKSQQSFKVSISK